MDTDMEQWSLAPEENIRRALREADELSPREQEVAVQCAMALVEGAWVFDHTLGLVELSAHFFEEWRRQWS